jgi:hypothetical protein
LTVLWNRLGPDKTLAALKVAAISDVTPEGLLVLEIAATKRLAAGPRHVQRTARTAPAGTCSGCGERLLLRKDGLIRSHRRSAFGSYAGCDGGGRAPVEDEPGNGQIAATEGECA